MSDREKIADFKRLVGIDGLPGLDAKDGVWADWRQLPEALSSEVTGLRLFYHHSYPVKTGLGLTTWTWRRRDKQLTVDVFVSGDGAPGARKRLVEIATDTTTVESQIVPALEKVGELSTEFKAHAGDDLLWVYRNI